MKSIFNKNSKTSIQNIVDVWTDIDYQVNNDTDSVTILNEKKIEMTNSKVILDKVLGKYSFANQRLLLVYTDKRIKKMLIAYLKNVKKINKNFKGIVLKQFLNYCFLSKKKYNQIKSKIQLPTNVYIISNNEENWLPNEKYVLENMNTIQSCKLINLTIDNLAVIKSFITKYELKNDEYLIILKDSKQLNLVTETLKKEYDLFEPDRIISLIGYQNINQIPIKKEKVLFIIGQLEK